MAHVLGHRINSGGTSYYRILRNGQMKYITEGADTFPPDFALNNRISRLVHLLPSHDDWASVTISRDPLTALLRVVKLVRRRLRGVQVDDAHAHPRHVEWADLGFLIAPLSGCVYEVRVPGTKPGSWISLVAKVAAGEGDIPRIEKEIRAYHALAGKGVTPRFEGYVTENGRIIGFLMSKVEIARSTGPND